MSSPRNEDDPETNPDQPNPDDVEFGHFDTQPLSPLPDGTMEGKVISRGYVESLRMQGIIEGKDACETQIMDFGEETQLVNLDGDTQGVDFGCETQVLNFDGETQVLNFDGETQVLNFDGETQVLDFDGETQLVGCSIGSKTLDGWLFNNDLDNGTLFHSDGEGSHRTEVLDDSDEQCDDDPCRHVADSVERQKTDCNSDCLDNENRGQRDNWFDRPCRSGSPQKGFTSIRAASLRASGLAARARTWSGDKEMSRPSQINRQSSEGAGDGISCMEVDAGNDNSQNEDKGNEFKSEVSRRIGSSAARKLFADKIESDGNKGFKRTVESTEPSSGNDELGGLSYIDSQEPGDLSQANALDFVDKFLEEASNELPQESNLGKMPGRKSLSDSSAKGPQRLAKSANKMSLKEKGIFDWDDFHEDEGGGDFFCRKKDVFFDTGSSRQISLTHPLKHKGDRVKEARNSSKAASIPSKIPGKLDTGLSVTKEAENDRTAEMIYSRNISPELDEQSKQDLLRGNAEHTESVTTEAKMVEIPNVGYDTQLAAEAMEALCQGSGLIEADDSNCQVQKNGDGSDYHKGAKGRSSVIPAGNGPPNGIKTRQTRKRARNDPESSKLSSISAKKQSRNKSQQGAGSTEIHYVDEDKKWVDKKISTELRAAVRPHFLGGVTGCTPVARRTRLSMMAKVGTENVSNTTSRNAIHAVNGGICRRTRSAGSRRNRNRNIQVFKMCKYKEDSAGAGLNQSEVIQDAKAARDGERSASVSATAGLNDSTKAELSCVSISRRESSDQGCGHRKLDGTCEQSLAQKVSQSVSRCRRSNSVYNISNMDMKRKTRSCTRAHAAMSNEENMGEVQFPVENMNTATAENAISLTGSIHLEGKLTKEQINMPNAAEPPVEKGDSNNLLSAGDTEAHARQDISPKEKSGVSNASCNTPVSQLTPLNTQSPVCMGNEYFKQSCRRNLSGSYLMKEMKSLSVFAPETPSPCKDLRRRRDMSEARVLYSHHLDDDIVKQQKKILARLGGSMASCIADATHFVTDRFVRTRNMLEAIASGKPIVTHLWLESCGQASCYLDERNYILRDARKEKEFGFSMPVSLARASRRPLLHGQKVFITPNTKPGKEIISSLVKAVHGQSAERIGRSALKDDRVPDDLLILSCEEDYNICIPFLEKGAAIYSSELLLNGIVTQKLEYERHRLFVDHVRRTRKTLWLKKDGAKFVPVGKQK